MMGLAVLAALGAYLWLSVRLTKRAAAAARARGIAGWKWGIPTALAMYHLIFWDAIPTVLAKRYYCQKDAGLVIHKTAEQWMAENPGVAEALKWTDNAPSAGGRDHQTYFYNDRFIWKVTSDPVFLSVRRYRQRVIDVKTNEVVIDFVDYSSGARYSSINELNDLRMMFHTSKSCGSLGNAKPFKTKNDFFDELGRAEKEQGS
jgi:hypothetical protein